MSRILYHLITRKIALDGVESWRLNSCYKSGSERWGIEVGQSGDSRPQSGDQWDAIT